MRIVSSTSLSLFLVGLVACGGDDGGGGNGGSVDAMPVPDAPTQSVVVAIGETMVCPDGFTEELSATQTETGRIDVVAQCEAEAENIILKFFAMPAPANPGDTAPCTEATFRYMGAQVNCRINNEALMPPSGEITLESSGKIDGMCSCTGTDTGTMETVEATATFRVDLETL